VPTSFLPWWDNAAQRQVSDLIRGLIEILVPFHRFRSVPGTYGLTCRLYSTPGGPAVSLTLGQIVEVVKVAASA
jgi:hypothetical protein